LNLIVTSMLTVLVCGLLILGGTFCLPIQAEEKAIASSGSTGEEVPFTLAIEEAGSKTVEVNELNRSQVIKEVTGDSGVDAEIPTQEIPKGPTVSSGDWRIVGIIIGICSLLIFTVIYLIKRKKI